MAARWQSLYFPSVDQAVLADALRAALTTAGYTLYDPFARFPGKAYPDNARLFVAPAAGGWLRVLVSPDSSTVPLPAVDGLCLSAALEASGAQITAYINGKAVDRVPALLPHARPGITADDLQNALHGKPVLAAKPNSPQQSHSLPLDALPEDIQQMAGGVNLKQAEKLFNRAAKSIFRGHNADEARALLEGDDELDWNSPGGAQISALMACLTIPANWREPEFTAVRDAYPLHLRKQQRPNAQLYPGDAQIMAAVPDALAYVPIYGGK